MRNENWRSKLKGIPCEYGTPKGHRLYIEVHHPEETTKSGIVLAKETRDKEGHASMFATVLSIGYGCWLDKADDWCDVGDKIIIGRHVGSRLQNVGDKDIRVIADLDVLGTL